MDLSPQFGQLTEIFQAIVTRASELQSKEGRHL